MLFMNQKILEEYSVKIYEIHTYFYDHHKEKIKVAKMSVNTYYLELMSILLNTFQLQKLMNKTTKAEILSLKKKDKRYQKKKLGCKFITINTSNAKKDYDTDYEVSKIQTFISKFNDKKNLKKRQKLKELEEEIKKLKLQLTNQSV